MCKRAELLVVMSVLVAACSEGSGSGDQALPVGAPGATAGSAAVPNVGAAGGTAGTMVPPIANSSGAGGARASAAAGGTAPAGSGGGGASGAAPGGTGGAEPAAGGGGPGMGGGNMMVQAPLADVSMFAGDGPFDSMQMSGGPGGAYALHVPMPLGMNGFKHPIITWGNGVGTTPGTYTAMLAHYATHGFLVVAANTATSGSGQEMIDGYRWAIEQNESMFEGTLRTDRVACVGYSMGGIGSVICGNEADVTTTVAIAGGHVSINVLPNPYFLVCNEVDGLVDPASACQPQFDDYQKDSMVKTPMVYGVSRGTTHLESFGGGGVHTPYVTAWLYLQLLDDWSVSGVFYGPDDCTLCSDPDWIVQRKQVPGM